MSGGPSTMSEGRTGVRRLPAPGPGRPPVPGPRGGVILPGDAAFDERYRVVQARDARFDGQFFTAVASTGIYCRPSCPARTPQPRNVSFYLTSAAAQQAGYRACRRCLPEATPGTPEWDLRRDLAGRAMRLIGDGVVDREGVEGLAARLGYSPRHLHRLLVAELGAGPLALARARRAQAARALLVASDLPAAEVAFAAGFGSVRQFNDTIREVFAARPGDLRLRGGAPKPLVSGAARAADPSRSAPVRLDLTLPVRQPFDAPGIFGFLAERAIAGVEAAELPGDGPLRYARTLTLPHGPGAAEVTAHSQQDVWQLRVRLELTALADVATAVSRLRRLLDLDADPLAVDAALTRDPVLARHVMGAPGIRVPGAADPGEMLIRAIVGQQITVRAARDHLGRLAAHLGEPHTSSFAGLTLLFPSPARIAEGLPEPSIPPDPGRPLRLPARSVRTIRETAAALADGELGLDVGADPAELRVRLTARAGIGPWTAGYVVMRVLGDPDTWMPGDVALLAGARALGLLAARPSRPAEHRALAVRAEAWAPWRSYAAMHLWRAAAPAAGPAGLTPPRGEAIEPNPRPRSPR